MKAMAITSDRARSASHTAFFIDHPSPSTLSEPCPLDPSTVLSAPSVSIALHFLSEVFIVNKPRKLRSGEIGDLAIEGAAGVTGLFENAASKRILG